MNVSYPQISNPCTFDSCVFYKGFLQHAIKARKHCQHRSRFKICYRKKPYTIINDHNPPGIKLVIGFANHYSYPVRCGFTDEQSMNIYLKHFQEVQQIIEQSIHGNNGVTIADKPTKIIKLK